MGKKIKLVKKSPIIQIGSFIQQNFGESVKYHGYGVYDVDDNKYQFIDLESEQPFYHFRITDIKDIEDEKEELLNS